MVSGVRSSRVASGRYLLIRLPTLRTDLVVFSLHCLVFSPSRRKSRNRVEIRFLSDLRGLSFRIALSCCGVGMESVSSKFRNASSTRLSKAVIMALIVAAGIFRGPWKVFLRTLMPSHGGRPL